MAGRGTRISTRPRAGGAKASNDQGAGWALPQYHSKEGAMQEIMLVLSLAMVGALVIGVIRLVRWLGTKASGRGR